jgi:hypothetical protein
MTGFKEYNSAATKERNMCFIFGCARSGTTSMAKILDTASNAQCLIEPNPNFNVESRMFLEGKLGNPYHCLSDIIFARAKPVIEKGDIYCEKNVTLFAFINELFELFNCKFVFTARDGRDIVQSMHNWHNELFGNFYRECKDPGRLSPKAAKLISELPVEGDTSDFSRPRPKPGDPYYEKWPNMSRHEMLCWYWNFVNNYILDKLTKLPKQSWIIVDYTSPTVDEIKKVFDFLNLEGFDCQKVESILKSRVNSLSERTGDSCPSGSWQDWTDGELCQFADIAGSAMQRLGYWQGGLPHSIRFCRDYGEYWRKDTDLAFYQYIFKDREPQHRAFMDWVKERDEAIETVCEVGCGRGVGYAEFFADKNYTGIDISMDNIEWCRQYYKNRQHNWICSDLIKEPPSEKFDLVFCQGTIENVYDMDALVARMAECCKKFLYITAFKGYFPELKEHVYRWNNTYKHYDNMLSLLHIRRMLERLGFSTVDIFPQRTQKEDIKFETVIIASR